MSSSNRSNPVILGDRRFRLGSRIGNGSFGEIYQADDLLTGSAVAVKLERCRARHPQIVSEYNVYRLLGPACGVPAVYWCGADGEYQLMAMELLGPNLEDLLQYCDNVFSLKTVLMIGIQMVSRLEHMHGKGYVHRDIKPQNILMGCGRTANTVFLIDLGLAKPFRDQSGLHLPLVKGLNLTGTVRYASINSHIGLEQSRRDDLEALGYLLIYFLKGGLPWMGIQVSSRASKEMMIMEQKVNIPLEILCSGLPVEFVTFIKYCRALQYHQDPDYDYLRGLLSYVFKANNFVADNLYDWTLKKLKQHEDWLVEIAAAHCSQIDS